MGTGTSLGRRVAVGSDPGGAGAVVPWESFQSIIIATIRAARLTSKLHISWFKLLGQLWTKTATIYGCIHFEGQRA